MPKLRTLALSLLLTTAPAWAFEPFVVRDIRVEGIERTEAGTVFTYLPVQVGGTLDEAAAARAIRDLFATGFFQDVRLDNENGVLVVRVQERPAIAEVSFTGLVEFEQDKLLQDFRRVGFAPSRIFEKAALDRAVQELKNLYYSKGHYAVEITPTVTPLPRNRVGIRFDIDEGPAASIGRISVVGNKAFPDDDLEDLFQLTTPNWLSWWTKSDRYSKEKLAGDVERLRAFYLDRGYLDFNIDSTQVMITPDKQQIYITINISEGEPYTVSSIQVAGDSLLTDEETASLIKLAPGDVFSRARLTESTTAIAERLGHDGYAFANVNAVPEVNREEHTVGFTFTVEPGRRVYVRRINVQGNDRTRDVVVRREMRQMEAAPYDGAAIERSRQRVDRLGFFDSVNIETPLVPDAADQVDLDLTVKERNTGNIMLGAGYSSADGVALMGSIQQSNWLGSGKSVGIRINTSQLNTIYSFSVTEPYFTVDGVSLGFDAYIRNLDTDYLSDSVGRYKTDTKGLGLRFGVPISETNNVRFGLAYDDTTIDTFDDSPVRYKDYVQEFGSSNSTVRADATWSRDTRDSLIRTTSGTYQKIFGEVGLPIADLRYYKLSYQYQWWMPIGRDFALMLNGDIAYGDGYDDRPLPFFKNFYAGGVNTVRGFETGTLGPKDSDGYAMGGNRRIVGNAELYFPLPGMASDPALRMSAFVDVGQVWAVDQNLDLSDLRYSTGLAVSWNSPFGPLKISYGHPMNASSDDKIQRFQFMMGSSF